MGRFHPSGHFQAQERAAGIRENDKTDDRPADSGEQYH
jgi:hypothetical protein